MHKCEISPDWEPVLKSAKSWVYAAAAAKSLQSYPTLYDPMDCSPPGFSVHGILQARVLEWGAIAFSENNIGYFPHKQGSNISILHKKNTESHELLYSDRPTCSELFN